SRVGAALVLTPARRVALVFPLGQHTRIADVGVLAGLVARAHTLRKQATIVGGDAYLRACAVAAGFAATTTLDEWQASESDASSTAHHARRRKRDAVMPALAIVEPENAPSGLGCDVVESAWELDPPEYVARLVPHDAEGAIRQGAGVTTRPRLRALEPPSDVAAFESAQVASERHEEDISDTIRETSGFPLVAELGSWQPPSCRAAGDDDYGDAAHP
nr:hypothetical protein [Ktedonobacterales bacterium]